MGYVRVVSRTANLFEGRAVDFQLFASCDNTPRVARVGAVWALDGSI